MNKNSYINKKFQCSLRIAWAHYLCTSGDASVRVCRVYKRVNARICNGLVYFVIEESAW